MLSVDNELLGKSNSRDAEQELPIIDESYKLFLVTRAIKNKASMFSVNYSTIAEEILTKSGIYISAAECSVIAKKYTFLIKKSNTLEIMLALTTIAFMFYVIDEGLLLGFYSLIVLFPFVYNFYSAIVVNIKLLFFSPESLTPSISVCPSLLKTTAIIIASRNEPFAVAKMTFDSAVALIAPIHKKEIIVVDNSDTFFPEYSYWKEYVESFMSGGIREIHGVRVVFIHRNGIEGFKPRNLDMAMEVVTAELVLYLDVDSTVRADTLLRIAPMFDWDEKIGFVQLHTVPTNANGKSPLAFVQSLRNYFLRLEMVFLTHASHSLFYGHNAMWRTSVVRSLGDCLEYYRNEVVVTEDLSMSFRARFNGYYGVGAWLESGEWVPESLRETEAMWLRWTVGTYQVYAKHFTHVKNLKKIGALEFLGWVQNFGYSVNYGLVPFYAIMGLLLDSSLLMWVFVMSLLPEMVQCFCAFFKLSLGKVKGFKKIYHCYAAFFILSTFINWVRCVGLLRYVARVKQGWTPTSKSSECEISFVRVIKERYGFLFFGAICFLCSAYILINQKNLSLHGFLVLMIGIYGLNMLFCVFLFGKARMHDELEGAVLERDINNFLGFYCKRS